MHDIRRVSGLFDMRADFVHALPYGSGHINDTYCTWYDQAGIRIRYIHQRINPHVFKKPFELMENVKRVTDLALASLLADGNPEARRRTLTVIPATDGKPYAVAPDGSVWRTYPCIERARAIDEIETNRQAYEAARAFGFFQQLAANLTGPRLHETIPDFHNTPKRLDALLAAIGADVKNRASSARAEIEFVLARANDCAVITNLLASGAIPERVTHNDTKINNVLLDDVTSEGVCVIDLDTTMPGSSLYDFGDLVRSATPTTREDETDITKLDIRLDRFEALVGGYLSSAHFLNSAETGHLAFSGILLTLECGIRFLTDYLQGDLYFKTRRPAHNFDRCRNQFALVAAMERKREDMERVVQQERGA
jgi:hypothetical protein